MVADQYLGEKLTVEMKLAMNTIWSRYLYVKGQRDCACGLVLDGSLNNIRGGITMQYHHTGTERSENWCMADHHMHAVYGA